MFAIVESGGKQYRVEEGSILEIELLDTEQIDKQNLFHFNHVLLIKDKDLMIGQPYVEKARVRAKVLEEFKAPKIIVFKKKSKKQYKRKRGHRQKLHRVQIEKIELVAKAKPASQEQKETKTKTEAKKGTIVKETVKKTAKPKTAAKGTTKTQTKPGAKATPKKKSTKPKAEESK